jgi:hypothetical protein
MFADPSVVKVATVNQNFVRTGISANIGTFTYIDADGNRHQLVIKQNETKSRFRRECRLTMDKDYTNPISGLTTPVSTSVYLVIDEPKAGFTDDELNDLCFGLYHFLSDASFANANTFKLLAGEY